MLTTRRAAVGAVVLAGLLAMGAGPPLPVRPLSRAERAAKLLPTPRLFETTTTIDGKSRGVTQLCESADTMLRQMQVRPPSERASAPADATKAPGAGCTHAFERRPDGVAHFEMSCERAAGARQTFRASADMVGEMQDVRHHMEATYETPAPHTVVTDTHTVMKGDCPADLKPGEMRMPDGTKREMAAQAHPG